MKRNKTRQNCWWLQENILGYAHEVHELFVVQRAVAIGVVCIECYVQAVRVIGDCHELRQTDGDLGKRDKACDGK